MTGRQQRRFLGLTADTWALVLGILGAVLTTVGFCLSFLTAPLVSGAAVDGGAVIGGTYISNKLLFSQKIFYFHVPVAFASFFFMFWTAYYGIRYLRSKERQWDTRARCATTIALVFIIGVMVMGVPWTRHDWGRWWVWEPRLITYLILMLLVIGYFIMRAAIEDEERRASYASVFGIIAFIDVPICYAITRLVPSSMHPVVFRTDSGLPPDMLIPFLISLFGMLMVAFGMYRLLLRLTFAQERLDAIKEQLEDGGSPALVTPTSAKAEHLGAQADGDKLHAAVDQAEDAEDASSAAGQKAHDAASLGVGKD